MKRTILQIVTSISLFSFGLVVGLFISGKVLEISELDMYAHQLMGLSGTLNQISDEGVQSGIKTMNNDLCSLISIIQSSEEQVSRLPEQTVDLLVVSLQRQGKNCDNYNALLAELGAN
ncbi:hypothetical protein [Microbulbifer agarilyticus]|uniref:hypothetical protein n=1 Tax=Microbulbifer agarilyticus TaxID=260552 RepID=UPI001CD4AA13|nr:hypothetical protein [Microbulbifer agarilyticus]MCA0902225.1 hypothetical protein [Microbulbifer agarilyticus]